MRFLRTAEFSKRGHPPTGDFGDGFGEVNHLFEGVGWRGAGRRL